MIWRSYPCCLRGVVLWCYRTTCTTSTYTPFPRYIVTLWVVLRQTWNCAVAGMLLVPSCNVLHASLSLCAMSHTPPNYVFSSADDTECQEHWTSCLFFTEIINSGRWVWNIGTCGLPTIKITETAVVTYCWILVFMKCALIMWKNKHCACLKSAINNIWTLKECSYWIKQDMIKLNVNVSFYLKINHSSFIFWCHFYFISTVLTNSMASSLQETARVRTHPHTAIKIYVPI
jgi:hypothetical protein